MTKTTLHGPVMGHYAMLATGTYREYLSIHELENGEFGSVICDGTRSLTAFGKTQQEAMDKIEEQLKAEYVKSKEEKATE